jgi:hypothetical protein
MPVTVKRAIDVDDGSADEATFTRFIHKPHWFVLAQTDGASVPPSPSPGWDAALALQALGITEIPFAHVDGNCLGFARERSIAINPINPLPHKTRFHEIGHVLLGHTSQGDQADAETTPRNLAECEAEAVALLCCAALELPGVEFSRGYIQSWWGAGNPIPEGRQPFGRRASSQRTRKSPRRTQSRGSVLHLRRISTPCTRVAQRRLI